MHNISIKFIDIMIGVILGLGFQWWPDLHLPWQFIAFIFVYIDIVDYWIDYSPSIRKFPPKRELDLLIDLAIVFSLFLFIYSTHLTVVYLLASFAFHRLMDFVWLLRAKYDHKPEKQDALFINTWIKFDTFEIALCLVLILVNKWSIASTLVTLLLFIMFRLLFRILASHSYKKVYFV